MFLSWERAEFYGHVRAHLAQASWNEVIHSAVGDGNTKYILYSLSFFLFFFSTPSSLGGYFLNNACALSIRKSDCKRVVLLTSVLVHQVQKLLPVPWFCALQ